MYDAFISYSHAADDRLAPALQRGLHQLARPWNRRRALRIFRDETSLATNPHLWASIESALDESAWFVLLASPEAAASEWVAKELTHWLATKSVDHLLPVVTDGKWEWDPAAGDFTAASSAVPDVLRGAWSAEPRHLDVRWARSETDLDLRSSRFRSAVADLAAPMHGVPKDELEGEDIRQHRRSRRLARGAVAIVVGLLIVSVVFGAYAVTQRNRANHERDLAVSAARSSALRSLVDNSATQRTTKRDLAALLAVAAYRIAPGPDTEGALLETFTGSPGYEGSVPVASGGSLVGVMLRDGRTYASVDEQAAVHLVDVTTGADTGNLPAIRSRYKGNDVNLDVSPDGRYLVLASDGATGPNLLTEWDLRARRRRFADRALDFAFGAVSFSPDGTLLALSGGPAAKVELRSARDGTLVRTLPSLPRPPSAHLRVYTAAVRFLPNGTLAVGSQSRVIRIFDVRSGTEIRRLTGPPETSEIRLAVAADARTLYGDGYAGVDAWDLATGRLVWTKPASGGACNDIVVADIVGALLCARVDDRVQGFDLATGATLAARFDYQAGVVSSIGLADRGRLLVENGGSALGLWRLDGTGPITRLVSPGGDGAPLSFVGSHALLLGRIDPATAGVISPRLVDAQTGRVLDPLRGVVEATPTPRPDRLGALFTDGTAGFYDLTAHHRVQSVRVKLSFVPTSAAFGGNKLFVAGGGNLQGIDATTGAFVEPSVRQATAIDGVIVDPTGRHIFTSESGTIVVRDVRGRRTGTVLSVGNIAVGAHLTVTASEDGRLRVLDTSTLRSDGADVESVEGATEALALSRDEGLLMISLRDGTLRLADMHTRHLVGDPISTGETTPAVIARDDDRAIAVATGNGTLVWDLDPADMVRAACRVASRNLTHAEWNANVIGLGPYERVCPNEPPATS